MSIAPLDEQHVAAGPRGTFARHAAWLHRGLDRLQAALSDPAWQVSSADLDEAARLARRAQAVELALIAKADDQGAHRRAGHISTASWVATANRTGSRAAHRDVALATTLRDELPATGAAFAAGEVSQANVGIIAKTMAQLPTDLAAAERNAVEQSLLSDASRMDPARLHRAALSALSAAEKTATDVAAHQEEVLAEQERQAYAKAFISMADQHDGTTTGRFLVPTGTAHALRKVLQSMTAPRRHATQPGLDNHDASGTSLARRSATDSDWAGLDWAQRQGRAFIDLLEHLDTSRLNSAVAATVLVTMSVEQVLGSAAAARLADQVRAADRVRGEAVEPSHPMVRTEALSSGQEVTHTHQVVGTEDLRRGDAGAGLAWQPPFGAVRTDTGHHYSTSAARRLACNAGILPLVLGGPSAPLDLGRTQRLFSDHQRLALGAIYTECATEDCDRPYAWCEVHHDHPWASGGRSDIAHAVPLCGAHHRFLHDAAFVHTISHDTSGRKVVRFHHRT